MLSCENNYKHNYKHNWKQIICCIAIILKLKKCLFKVLLYVDFKKYIWNITSMNQKVNYFLL